MSKATFFLKASNAPPPPPTRLHSPSNPHHIDLVSTLVRVWMSSIFGLSWP